MSVVSKLQFTHASRSSHSWLSKQPKLLQSSKLVVASLSCAELGRAQPRLVVIVAAYVSVVVQVLVVALIMVLIIVADHIVFGCGKEMLSWNSWRLLFSFCYFMSNPNTVEVNIALWLSWDCDKKFRRESL